MTNYQRKKFIHLFNLLDINKNGHLQPADFSAAAETIRDKLNLPELSTRYRQLRSSCQRLFDRFRDDMVPARKRVIKPEEWLSFFEKEVITNGNLNIIDDYKDLIYGFLFDIFDGNNDGYISRGEYREMFQLYGLDIKDSTFTFNSIDFFADDRLSKYELVNAIEVFLISDNPSDRGNLIFGRID